MSDLVIHDGNADDHFSPLIDGNPVTKGLDPRNYRAVPFGSMEFAPSFDMHEIPESEWRDRIATMERDKSRLSDIMELSGPGGGAVPPLDQNGKGYCWAHSTTMGVIATRATMNLPYQALSAYAVACIIKHYRDQGGSGDESAAWIVQNGVPSEEFWPQQSMNPKNDNQAMRANAALNKITKWYDLESRNFRQLATCLLNRRAVVADLNWWGHSVLFLDLVYQQGQYGVRFINSWGASYGSNGRAVLLGSKAVPDGQVCVYGALANAA